MLKRHNFNLIEIIIALGIVLVGVCSLMVIFPIGANASRDAAVQIEASNAVEQFLSFVKFKVSTEGVIWITGKVSEDPGIPEIPGNLKEKSEGAFDEDSINDYAKWERLDLKGEKILLFKDKDSEHPEKHKGVFQLLTIRSKNPTKISDLHSKSYEDINVSPDILIDKRMIFRAESDDFVNTGKISIEVSWPAEVDHSLRKSEVFVLTLRP